MHIKIPFVLHKVVILQTYTLYYLVFNKSILKTTEIPRSSRITLKKTIFNVDCIK